ncbi:MAG: hypothetical protein GY926_11135 [bacterium]|nr:hypothetical protein [bacterium]MCP4965780.1 hypothetical protein [bacterium]
MKKSPAKIISIEELLDVAGFDYTTVERCPHPACEICTEGVLAVAA